MNTKIIILASFVFIRILASDIVYATHNRAGEITYKHLGSFLFEFTIITYTNGKCVAADRPTLDIHYGDGTTETLFRVPPNGEELPSPCFNNCLRKNTYIGTHDYGVPGEYTIWMRDANRIAEICNIDGRNSVGVPFYIESQLNILDPQFFGFNSSPDLLQPPVDCGNVCQVFKHNPNAYDPDGDSLAYELVVPKSGKNNPVPNYQYPNEITDASSTCPSNTNMSLNPITGEFIWDAPQKACIYNIAILIKEYRGGKFIGSILRDMQIVIKETSNRPPVIDSLNDTCIIAGTNLERIVVANDPDGDNITLTAAGGPLQIATDPATFTDGGGSPPVSGQFKWQTTCEHIRKGFYQVVFKAEDNGIPPLVDLETWLITVVAPPPANLIATPILGDITLSWENSYSCAASSKFTGFSVWRKIGSNPFIPDT
ncbi:MAG: gliding motility-associated C-terminal domain-containing protein, partial [Bacteroidetes bacterium]|nr:gliding motility-associated C-terminal domain-containing protein [Bacteroidota bacterium]